jgi:hypothetical protein
MPQLLYTQERPRTFCTGDWVGCRAGLGQHRKSFITGIGYPDLPNRSKSLHQLSYPCPLINENKNTYSAHLKIT